jgi:hypothetical protein
MTAAMAAMVPGGCVKVDPAECVAATAPPEGGGWTPGSGTNTLTPGQEAGRLALTFRVLRADTARPAVGVPVSAEVFRFTLLGTRGEVVERLPEKTTGPDGAVSWDLVSPAPAKDYGVFIQARSGGGIAFSSTRSTIGVWQPNGVTSAYTSVVVCPEGTDPVVCEVGTKQLQFQLYAAQRAAALNANGNPQIEAAARGQAHDMIRDMPVSDPLLAKYWYDNLSYAVTDLAIPPTDWPELLKNYDLAMRIWGDIPWPGSGELQKLFRRCAGAIEIHKGMGFYDPRLYAPSTSDFFPREEQAVREALATAFLSRMIDIYRCMEHRIEKKAENIERQEKKWKVISTVVMVMFAAGGDFYKALGTLISVTGSLSQFESARQFSEFMLGYNEFVKSCQEARSKDFVCEYMAPFMLWCMETILLQNFFDWAAIEAGLPGAREGLTQEVIDTQFVPALEAAGVSVPAAAYTPGGEAPKTGAAIAVAGGAGALLLLLFGAMRG